MAIIHVHCSLDCGLGRHTATQELYLSNFVFLVHRQVVVKNGTADINLRRGAGDDLEISISVTLANC